MALIEDEVVEQREKLLLINWRMSRGVLLGDQIRGNINDLSRNINKRKSTKYLVVIAFLLNILILGYIAYIKISKKTKTILQSTDI